MPAAPERTLVEGVRRGDARAIARAISLVENEDPAAVELVRDLYPSTGRAVTVGITGPPGVGKSTLVARLVRRARSEGRTVGAIAVDPTSPFSSGALLGDRIRLAEHALDPAVFLRSMATRGRPGGVAESTLLAVLVLDAAGKELVLVETAGVGQSEVDVSRICDTVVLVLMPGAGDSLQPLKAGVMEIPDVIVVNRRDHPDAPRTAAQARAAVATGLSREWPIPVVLTDAVRSLGIEELAAATQAHRAHLFAGGRLGERRRRGLSAEVLALARARIARRVEQALPGNPAVAEVLERLSRHELDPLSAVLEIVDRALEVGLKADAGGACCG
jgi:LAO/AO transport system kinase